MDYLLPGLTAQFALDAADIVIAAGRNSAPGTATLVSRYQDPPPVTEAKWCGSSALQECGRQARWCAQFHIDCSVVLEGCGVCPEGMMCKDDLGGVLRGYTFCCPPDLWPCGGRCVEVPSSCGTGELVGCECLCLRGGDCRGDDGRVTDCCEGTEVCSHGHCCQPGERWVDDHCCANHNICLEPLNWTTSGLYAEVSESRETCCDPPRVCAPDHGPPGSLLAPGSPTYGHCCQPGEQWFTSWDVHLQAYAGKCCAPSKICKEPRGWSGNVVDASADVCCSDSEDCTPDPRFAGYGHCCLMGKTWCQGSYIGRCCESSKCCGNYCCTGNQHCSHDHCCPPNQDWAAGLTGPAVPSWQEGSCCPASVKPQKWCGPSNYGGFRCCDADRCCGGECCLVGQQCSNGHCCPGGQAWCGGKCCDPAACCPDALFGTVCADLSSDAAHCGSCGNRCITAEGQYCRNGQCVCLQNRPTCGGHCCLSTEVCDGNMCVAPSVPCDAAQHAGGPDADIKNVKLGSTAGWYAFTWNAADVPDHFILRTGSPVPRGGATIHDTGCVGGNLWGTAWSGRVCKQHSGTPTTVEVEVKPNCNNSLDITAWTYTVGCPVYTSKQACCAGDASCMAAP